MIKVAIPFFFMSTIFFTYSGAQTIVVISVCFRIKSTAVGP